MATVGKPFRFTVYSRLWNREDTYRLVLTTTGWRVRHLMINGDCQPDGTPFLFQNLDQDRISYPAQLGKCLSWLFEHRGSLSNTEMQTELRRLADWVSTTERVTPTVGLLSDIL